MGELHFNCGEFKPGKPPLGKPPIKKPGGGGHIVVPPIKLPPDRPNRKVPPVPPDTGGPGVPGPTAPGPTEPNLYKCVVTGNIECKPNEITVTIGQKRECRKCTNAEVIADIRNHNKGGGPRVCVPKPKCEKECKDIPPVCRLPGPITQPTGSIGLPQGGGSNTVIIGESVGSNGGGGAGNSFFGGGGNKAGESVETRQSLINIERLNNTVRNQFVIDIPEVTESVPTHQNASSFGGIYHADYTLFTDKTQTSTISVPNDQWLHIFNGVIAKEVDYILRNINNTDWKEVPLNKLSLAHIAFSLQPRLLSAFNNIKHPDGSVVPVNNFLETIRLLLVTGRLDEVNPQFYINLAEVQSVNPGVFFKKGTREQNENYALGIMAASSLPIDPPSYDELGLQSQKRYRPLLEDIEVSLIVEILPPSATTIAVGNAGISAVDLNGNISVVDAGEGAGYYVSTVGVEGSLTVPLVLQTQASASYFAPAGLRSFSMSLLNVDPTIRMTASAPVNQSEFEASGTHTTSAINEVGYFYLEQSSVSYIDNDDSIVDLTTAVYRRLTYQTDIDRHAKDYGFGITRINVDYRDPWYQYAMNTSSITVHQNDIGYGNFKDKRTAFSDKTILVRNIAQGFVFVPGKGSEHNPYGANSRITSVRPTVIRELFIQENFIGSDAVEKPPLLPVYSGDEDDEFFVGLVEKINPDVQTLYFKFDKDSAVYSGTYFSNQETTSSGEPRNPATTKMVRDIFEDTLKVKYDIDEAGITWWDLYRRMTLSQFAELDYNTNSSFYAALKNGWRGHRVHEVLNRPEEDGTGLGPTDNSPATADPIFLTQIGRRSAQNY